MTTTQAFEYGTCTVPCGKQGPWTIDEFTIEKDSLGAFMQNFRAIRDGHAFTVVHPGTFKRLHHKDRGVVMSNTQMEIVTSRVGYFEAKGSVLVNGLGMGMFVEGIANKPEVKSIRVVEIDKDVIKLVAPYYQRLFPNRVQVVEGDAYEYKPHKFESYDYIWHDIWDDLSEDNLPLMNKLSRKWAGRGRQGFWSRNEMRAQRRRDARW